MLFGKLFKGDFEDVFDTDALIKLISYIKEGIVIIKAYGEVTAEFLHALLTHNRLALFLNKGEIREFQKVISCLNKNAYFKGNKVEAVRYFFEKNLPVCAICHGQQILISANVLQGRKATCYSGIKDDLINAGANYIDDRAVVDGNLVTSRCPNDLPYFMGEFIKLLRG